MIKKVNKNEYKVLLSANTNIIKIILPIGYNTKSIPRGYAHFVEHMFIRNNYDFLCFIEKNGGWFNGTTFGDYIEIIIYNIDSSIFFKQLHYGNLIKWNRFSLSKELVDREKSNILNEYGLLVKNNKDEEVTLRIGSEKDILNFDMDIANKLLNDLEDYKVLYYSNFKSEMFKDLFDKNFNLNVEKTPDYFKVIFNNRKSKLAFKILFKMIVMSGYKFTKIDFNDEYMRFSYNDYVLLKKNINQLKNRFDILISVSFSKFSEFVSVILSGIDELGEDICVTRNDINKVWSLFYE